MADDFGASTRDQLEFFAVGDGAFFLSETRCESRSDRNGNVHTYTRDVLGRTTIDAVTTLGSGVDGSVRRVETAYDSQGNPYLVTTYDAASAGNIVNQIQREYNGLGHLITEYHAANGAVNTSTTPKVQYAYSFTTGGTMNHSRLTFMTYPNGRVLTYNYSSGINNDISRLSSITDGATTLESYDYLGAGTVVRRGHAEPGVDLTYIGTGSGDAGDKYLGLDRFGRIVDQRWTTTGGTDRERTKYGYDRNSNRLWRENTVNTARSELYQYDGLNQLIDFKRGTLNTNKNGIQGSPSRTQSWDFDALGNFDSQTTNGTAQTRSHNRQNEITSVGSANPEYDANGNMTKNENRMFFTYDAWNRLIRVKDSNNNTLATYEWDGQGRRVQEDRGGITHDLYYSAQWQVIEERFAENKYYSYAWSPVYVDALIARDEGRDGSMNERLYAMHDANFNIVGLVDVSGSVVERYAYDPFGVFTVLDASWATLTASNYAWTYLHQGGRWDAIAGLYSFRHREYSPTLGRWMTNDPIGFGGGDSNNYRYCANFPIFHNDPFGLWVIDRANSSKATAVSEAGDTFKGLADKIGLEAKEIVKWITFEDINEYSITDPICSGLTVEIPNTILSLWAGDIDYAGMDFVKWHTGNSHLKHLGFNVRRYKAGESKGYNIGNHDIVYSGIRDKSQFFKVFNGLLSQKELHGFYFYGHGNKSSVGEYDGLALPHKDFTASTSSFYHLAYVILKVCDGDLLKNALSASSPNAIFFGVSGTYYPKPLSEANYFINNGEQGTKILK